MWRESLLATNTGTFPRIKRIPSRRLRSRILWHIFRQSAIAPRRGTCRPATGRLSRRTGGSAVIQPQSVLATSVRHSVPKPSLLFSSHQPPAAKAIGIPFRRVSDCIVTLYRLGPPLFRLTLIAPTIGSFFPCEEFHPSVSKSHADCLSPPVPAASP